MYHLIKILRNLTSITAYHATFRRFRSIPANHSYSRIFSYSQLFIDYSEANFKAIDTVTEENEVERNKQKAGRKETKSLVSDMTEFRCRNFHEERSSTSPLGTAPPDREDRSLLFAIVSTGHCIRVEGSRSRIEVAAEVLSASTFYSRSWICGSMSRIQLIYKSIVLLKNEMSD